MVSKTKTKHSLESNTQALVRGCLQTHPEPLLCRVGYESLAVYTRQSWHQGSVNRGFQTVVRDCRLSRG